VDGEVVVEAIISPRVLGLDELQELRELGGGRRRV
jgi:hypothetical protein